MSRSVMPMSMVLLLAAGCSPESGYVPPTPLSQGADDRGGSDDPGTDDGRDEDRTSTADWEITDDLIVLGDDDAEVLVLFSKSAMAPVLEVPVEGRLGGPPVVHEGKVLVTLRDARSLVVLEPAGRGKERTLVETLRVEVGPEPRDVLLSPSGRKAWVAVSMEDVVREVDLITGRLERTLPVDGSPRWLTLLPDDRILVASQRGPELFTFDGVRLDTVRLPMRSRKDGADYRRRVTGRPVVDLDDDTLWIPSIFTDTNPLPSTASSDAPLYAQSVPEATHSDKVIGGGTTRFMSGLVSTGFDLNMSDSRVTHLVGMDSQGRISRGLLSGVWADPGSDLVVATMPGADAIVAVRPLRASRVPRVGEFEQHLVAVGLGPAGLVDLQLHEGLLYGYGTFDHEVARWHANAIRSSAADALAYRTLLPEGETASATEPGLSGEIERGRYLFHSSNARSMVAHNAGLSCATCHIEGGVDGLTWPLEVGLRQTPSLAGEKSAQTPLSWSTTVPDVPAEVRLTTERRMGGAVPSMSDQDALTAYIDHIPVPDTTPLYQDPLSITRGKAVFESTGCTACHRGDQLTTRAGYAMAGVDFVRTPTLQGIRATAPYYHDGRAPTLRDAVDQAEHVGMAVVRTLTDEERDDLVRYLETL